YIEEGATNMTLFIEAIKNVCDQVGIKPSDIEGIAAPGYANALAEYLHIRPKWIDTTAVGGCSFQMQVHHAMAAINAGILDIAVVAHGESGYSARKNNGKGRGPRPAPDPWAPAAMFEG